MREPGFWYRPPSMMSALLSPLGVVYGAATAWRMQRAGQDIGIPVICIGNYHVGGAGKTPATLKVASILRTAGETPFVVSRGYGGELGGPVRVDPQFHTTRDVGDEPLMTASHVPVIVARDRVAGALLAKSEGASVVLLDDGFQNPSLNKNLSLIVIDGERGVGNGEVFPAGPLRAPLPPQIARTNAVIIVGEGHSADLISSAAANRGALVLLASLKADQSSANALHGQRVLAFAGIGDPQRFFATLRANGVNVIGERSFADHHVFSPADIEGLVAEATAKSLKLVTTAKDMVRIRSDARLSKHATKIVTLKVSMEFEDEEKLRQFVVTRISDARKAIK